MYIHESYLSFLWQNMNFNSARLCTTSRETVVIKHPGILNKHAGPDFLESRIRIGGIEWIGDVEIHVKSSHWYAHDHASNLGYDNVILHVVWKDDIKVQRSDGTIIPTIELQDRVSPESLHRLSDFMYSAVKYPCHTSIKLVKKPSILAMIDSTLLERMERRAKEILRIHKDSGKDWEETSYRVLSRNFGFKVNQDNMFLLSKLIPFSILSRHRKNRIQTEALLLGMAGLLERPVDAYSGKLYNEYTFLKYKYKLNGSFLRRHQWRFLRLRPQNFPTVRIAQLAKLFGKMDKIFSAITEFNSLEPVMNFLRIKQSLYWQHHYDLGKRCSGKLAGLGIESIRNILINTFVPVLTAYSRSLNNEAYFEKAVEILGSIPPEQNHIVRDWAAIGIHPSNSCESQGLIELSNVYCNKKKCLNCDIGREILVSKT